MLQRIPGFGENQQGGDQDQHAFDHGGKEFRFVVAVGMIGVGRASCEGQGHPGYDAGRDIDGALKRVGIEGGAAGQPPGSAFESKDQATGDNADLREPCPTHASRLAHRPSRVSRLLCLPPEFVAPQGRRKG